MNKFIVKREYPCGMSHSETEDWGAPFEAKDINHAINLVKNEYSIIKNCFVFKEIKGNSVDFKITNRLKYKSDTFTIKIVNK